MVEILWYMLGIVGLLWYFYMANRIRTNKLTNFDKYIVVIILVLDGVEFLIRIIEYSGYKG